MRRFGLISIVLATGLGCADLVAIDEESPESEPAPYEPTPCVDDSDCDYEYVCAGGECRYNDGKQGFGCIQNNDCGYGQYCDEYSYDCVSARPIEACTEGLIAWTESIAQLDLEHEVLGLDIADLDADGDAEIIVRIPDLRLQVVDIAPHELSLGTLLEPPSPTFAEHDWLDLDADGLLDILLHPGESGATNFARGLGAGAFGPWETGPVLAMHSSVPIQWEPGGPAELAGLLLDDVYGAAVGSDLLGAAPSLETFGIGPTGSALDHLLVADFDGDGLDELLFGDQCSNTIRARAGWAARIGGRSNDWGVTCPLATGDFNTDGKADLVVIDNAVGVSLISLMSGRSLDASDLDSNYVPFDVEVFDLPDTHGTPSIVSLEPVLGAMIWFPNDARPKLVHRTRSGFCHQPFEDELPSYQAHAFGDLDADGDDELVLVDDTGTVRLYDATAL